MEHIHLQKVHRNSKKLDTKWQYFLNLSIFKVTFYKDETEVSVSETTSKKWTLIDFTLPLLFKQQI